MINLFTADLIRVFCRKPRIILWLVTAAAIALHCLGIKDSTSTLKMVSFGLDVFFPVALAALGLVDFIFVFTDNLDSKADISFPGRKERCWQFAAVKLLEAVIVFTVDLVMLNFVCLILIWTSLLNPAYMSVRLWAILNFSTWIRVMISMLAGSVFLFGTDSITAAGVAYLTAVSGTAERLAAKVLQLPCLANLHMDNWMPNNLAGTFASKLFLGVTDWAAAAALIAF